MTKDAEDIQQRRLLQKEYGSFYRAVSDILFEHNIMDLDGRRNTGEYDREVDDLLQRMREIDSQESLQVALHQVFATAFGEENCGTRATYDSPASEIWKAYERHRKK